MRQVNTLILLICAFLCIVSCSPNNFEKTVVEGEKIPIPEFIISISLSKKASNKLKRAGESIKGTIYFDGKSLPGIKSAPFRDVYLGKYEFEIKTEGDIKIDKAQVSKEAYSRLEDKNYHFTVNVYSGRRAFKNNILDGGYAQGRRQDIELGKRVKIICDLL